MQFLLGKKLKMSQIWKGDKVTPVTVIDVSGNKITLTRNTERDGYDAIQLALGRIKREFKSKDLNLAEIKVGDEVNIDIKEGDMVRASGLTKGRGFQGVVKRHGFHGGPKTHGQKNRYRAGGSIGSTAPQRVIPGRRMAGRMGNERVTIKNLEVVQVDTDKKLLYLKGAVPGATGGLLEIQKISK